MAFLSMLVPVRWIHVLVSMNPVVLSMPANNFKIFIFHLTFYVFGGWHSIWKCYFFYVLKREEKLNRVTRLLKYDFFIE